MLRDAFGLGLLLACVAVGWLPGDDDAVAEPEIVLPPMPFVQETADGGWRIHPSPYLTKIAEC